MTLDPKALVSLALANDGRLPLAALAAAAVPVERLRELARKHGLSPKGFRVEKAPAAPLAELLADPAEPELVDELMALLVPALRQPEAAPQSAEKPHEPTVAVDLRPMLALRERELRDAKDRLEQLQEQAQRQRLKEDELRHLLETERLNAIRLRAELEGAQQRRRQTNPDSQAAGPAAPPRVRELERALEEADVIESALRMRLAEQQTKLDALTREVHELTELVPKGKRKKPPPPEPKAPRERMRIAYFTPAFYRSLADKERRSVEQAFAAVLTLCREGLSYPGLEVKQLEGIGLWSLRAGLKLRVYFRMRSDGDVEIDELADREEQNTTLRRLKDRG